MSPWLTWLRRWGISIASLVGGLLTLFVFQRGLPRAPYIVGYVLLLWLLVAVTIQLREALEGSERRAARLVITAGDYVIQTLYHGILLFLLPAYWASSTLTSVNVAFLGALVGLALLATFDPWYEAIVHPFPWFRHVFFLLSIFGALNVALPLVGIAPFAALVLSAWTSVVALTPAARRAWRWPWSQTLAVTAAIGVAAAALAMIGRAWIPPVPMFLAGTSLGWVAESVDGARPERSAVPAVELQQRGLVAYTAVYAPAGLKQPIEHVWRHNGRAIDVVRLAPVAGGRREGYRTFSRKTGFPTDAVGKWTVDVMTASGQLIGRLRFTVVP